MAGARIGVNLKGARMLQAISLQDRVDARQRLLRGDARTRWGETLSAAHGASELLLRGGLGEEHGHHAPAALHTRLDAAEAQRQRLRSGAPGELHLHP